MAGNAKEEEEDLSTDMVVQFLIPGVLYPSRGYLYPGTTVSADGCLYTYLLRHTVSVVYFWCVFRLMGLKTTCVSVLFRINFLYGCQSKWGGGLRGVRWGGGGD